MITEQEILDLGFEKLDYSTEDEQYYLIDISRATRFKQYDAHQEYKLTVNLNELNKYKLDSTLKLAQSFFLPTTSRWGNWTTIAELEEVLHDLIRWDLAH